MSTTTATRRRVALIAITALTLGVAACSSSDPEASVAAPATEVAAATTAPAARAPVVAKGTFSADPTPYSRGVQLPDGSTKYSGGSSVFAGDLVGTYSYTVVYHPADASGQSNGTAEGVFVGSLTGVGDGSFTIREQSTLTPDGTASITGTLDGVSGVFVGMTGTETTTASGYDGEYNYSFSWA